MRNSNVSLRRHGKRPNSRSRGSRKRLRLRKQRSKHNKLKMKRKDGGLKRRHMRLNFESKKLLMRT